MKKFMIGFIALVGLANTSLAQVIAELPVRMNGAVAIAQLDDNGTLLVTKYRIRPFRFAAESEVLDSVTVDLNQELFTRLQFAAISLSNAKIETRHSEIVCAMMPPAGPSPDLKIRRGYDRHQGFLGELKVVQTQRGCWAHTHVSLKEQYQNERALSFRGSLEALAIQAIS